MLIEFGLGLWIDAIEVGEEVGGVDLRLPSMLGLTFQILDDCLGIDFFLNVERRRLDHEIGPVLTVLTAPNELRVTYLKPAGLVELRYLVRA